jgi:ubiquinone/menaquinone biosynthesis C-methylase UbiE
MIMSRQGNLKDTNEPLLSDALLQMIGGYRVSRLISAAAKLGIADLLKDSPKTIEELAKSTNTDVGALYRLMRALASVGVFVELDQGRFTLTPLAELLQTDVPGSLRAIAIMQGEDWHWKAWGDFLYSLKTGSSAFEHVFGMDLFKYLAHNPKSASNFDEAMSNVAMQKAMAVTNAYDFSGIRKIVDVGGGNGTFITKILKANPQMKGVLFDLAHVVEHARNYIKASGLAERCECVAGDFLQSVPQDGDAYFLSSVIHNWDDNRAIAILKSCHRAMAKSGKVLLVEAVITPGNEPHFSKLLDIQMLVITPGGRGRTETEYRLLFDAAGFKLMNIVPTQSPWSIVEGVSV